MTDTTSNNTLNTQPHAESTSSREDLRLLSVNEARKILGIRPTTLKRLIEQGRINAVEINGKYKLSLQSIKSFVNPIKNEINHKNNSHSINNENEKTIINDILKKYI
jgi:excisionase family DNA binding protein